MKKEDDGDETGAKKSGNRKIPQRVKDVLYAVLIVAGIVMIVLSGRYLASERYGADIAIEGDDLESEEEESPRFYWMLM